MFAPAIGSRPLTRTRTGAGALVLALALVGACGGPREPLDIGVKGFPSDVVLGAPDEEAAVEPARPPVFVAPDALPPPAAILPALPPPPRGFVTPTTVEDRGPCPTADPFAAPRLEAPSSVFGPPAEATYTSHNEGEVSVSGPNAAKGPVPATTTRTIRKVAVASDTSFTHEVVSVLGDTTTTTSYRTVPIRAGGGSGGIFITAMTTKTGSGAAETFDPSPDLEIMRFPAEVGLGWNGFAGDPNARQAMAYAAKVDVKRRVDACGTILDGQVVHLTGDFVPCAEVNPPNPPPAASVPRPSPVRQCAPPQPGVAVDDGNRTTFKATYVFGTQYGGITLLENTTIDSTEGGVGAHRTLLSVIDREPVPAKGGP